MDAEQIGYLMLRTGMSLAELREECIRCLNEVSHCAFHQKTLNSIVQLLSTKGDVS